MANFSFEITHKDKNSLARSGLIKTRNGKIETPYFVPVATAASVRGLDNKDLEDLGVQCLLSNTYHLMLSPPSDEGIKNLGGLHKFMNFQKPIFTDSGGFQAFSLGFGMEHGVGKIGSIFPEENTRRTKQSKKEKWAKVTDKGIQFYSPRDGTKRFIGPKESMKIQENLDSDIIMAFDECTSPEHDEAYTSRALERTHKWAKESLKYHNPQQALYGIIQGGMFKSLREKSMKFISSLPFDGIAIGGSLGKSKKDMQKILEWVTPNLDNRPRHLLGIGGVDDLFESVERGIDTFDCVEPTRLARRGMLLISPSSGGNVKNKFRMNITKFSNRLVEESIEKNCECYTCKNHSLAYLHHLFKAGEKTYGEEQRQVSELLYFRLATIHNVHFMLNLMQKIRGSIKGGKFSELKKSWLK